MAYFFIMSMSFEAFEDMIEEIKAQGYDEKTAANFARWIGDTPCMDQDGKLVVEDDKGNVLARLEPFNEEEAGA